MTITEDKRKVLSDKNQAKIEDYLAEVVERLMDTEQALLAGQFRAYQEKDGLATAGSDFRYQQSIIDISEEIFRYASGEISLSGEVARIVKQTKEIREEGVEVL